MHRHQSVVRRKVSSSRAIVITDQFTSTVEISPASEDKSSSEPLSEEEVKMYQALIESYAAMSECAARCMEELDIVRVL